MRPSGKCEADFLLIMARGEFYLFNNGYDEGLGSMGVPYITAGIVAAATAAAVAAAAVLVAPSAEVFRCGTLD